MLRAPLTAGFEPQRPVGVNDLERLSLWECRGIRRDITFWPIPIAGGTSAKVHAAWLVKAKPLYGYFESERLFVKVELYDPRDLSKVQSLLLNGAVLGAKLQPFNAHVGFKLQSMMDLGIAGMDLVYASNVLLREDSAITLAPGNAVDRMLAGDAHNNSEDVVKDREHVLLDAKRSSPCDIEADVHAVNVVGTAQGDGESVPSFRELWNEERRRCEAVGLSPPDAMNANDDDAGKPCATDAEESSSAARERLRLMVQSDLSNPSYGEVSSLYANLLQRAVPAEGSKWHTYPHAVKAGDQADHPSPDDRGGKKSGAVSEQSHGGGDDCRMQEYHEEEEEENEEDDEGLWDLLLWMRGESNCSQDKEEERNAEQAEQMDSMEPLPDHVSAHQQCKRKREHSSRQDSSENENSSNPMDFSGGNKAVRTSDLSRDSLQQEQDASWQAGELALRDHTSISSDITAKEESHHDSVVLLRPRITPPESNQILDDLLTSGVFVANSSGATYPQLDDWKRVTEKPHRPTPGCTAPSRLPYFRSVSTSQTDHHHHHHQNMQSASFHESCFAGGIESLKMSSNLPSKGCSERGSVALPVKMTPCTVPPDRANVLSWLRGIDHAHPNGRGDHDEKYGSRAQPQRPASPKYDEVAGLAAPAGAGSASNVVSQVTQITEKRNSAFATQGGYRLESGAIGVAWATIELDTEAGNNMKMSDPRRCMIRAASIAASDDKSGGQVIIVVGSECTAECDRVVHCKGEEELLRSLVQVVLQLDPDVLIGHDILHGSLGYLRERSTSEYGWDVLEYIGRASGSAGSDWEGVQVVGRVCLNLWRIVKDETSMSSDTLEAAAEGVLGERVPSIPRSEVERWWTNQGHGCSVSYALERLNKRSALLAGITSRLDVVGRAAEMARVLAIDFRGVVFRGSQYRVEAVSLRLARQRNFAAPSPTEAQVQAQPAMQAMPLTMEPKSRFFSAPVAVLDFQSLYPSLIVAYNLCFSTCIGVPPPSSSCSDTDQAKRKQRSMGILSEYDQHLRSVHPDSCFVAPNGACFVQPHIREGVLPKMLREVLSTRSLAKDGLASAEHSGDNKLARTWDARQLALKLLANVTYGYTAAGYSGRMPMAELADAIVQTARSKLETTAQIVRKHPSWNAEVVYGDTDSLFIHMSGRTRQQAFDLAHEIAQHVTSSSVSPIKLKVEKVYEPSVLCVKKRYAGLAFSSKQDRDSEGSMDVKGIESIRRDACPIVAKVINRGLKVLFKTCGDLSATKQTVQSVFQKVLDGRAPLSEFVFRKEVRLGEYSASARSLPAAAIVASRIGRDDPRATPQKGERVPFIVLAGHPSDTVSSLVAHPLSLSPSSIVSAKYYLHSQMAPALDRVLGRAGADVFQWLMELKPSSSVLAGFSSSAGPAAAGAFRIESFYMSSRCAACGANCSNANANVNASVSSRQPEFQNQELCNSCRAMPLGALSLLAQRSRSSERSHRALQSICMSCGGTSTCGDGIVCNSLDCPVYYLRIDAAERARSTSEQLKRTLSM